MNNPIPSGGWQRTLYYAFRSRSFLWKFAIGTLLTGVASGFGISLLQPSEANKLGARILASSGLSLEDEQPAPSMTAPPLPGITQALTDEIEHADATFSDIIRFIPTLAPHITPAERIAIRQALERRFSVAEAELASDYLAAWSGDDPAALNRLKAKADLPEAPRFANYATGRIELRNANYLDAYQRFHKEGERADASESRSMAAHTLLKAKDYVRLAALLADPRYEMYATPHMKLEMAIGQKDWRAILRLSPLAQISSYETSLMIVTSVAGLAWAFFLGHLGEITKLLSVSSVLCGFAFVAGVLSTVPTVYLVILEEDFLHLSAGLNEVQILAYHVGGVGLREELCKLLLFLPLVPFLIRRNNELEVLIVASFVGLGFAVEENCGYYIASEATSGPGRFLTANFFHMTLTGLNGLAFTRVFTRGKAGLNYFLFIFPVTVLVHGLYNALPDLAALDGIGDFLGTGIYIGFAMFYFNQVHPLRDNVRMTFGLTGAFVVSVSFMAATVIAYVMIILGPRAGLSAIIPELLGCAVLLFLFFREFDEQLSS